MSAFHAFCSKWPNPIYFCFVIAFWRYCGSFSAVPENSCIQFPARRTLFKFFDSFGECVCASTVFTDPCFQHSQMKQRFPHLLLCDWGNSHHLCWHWALWRVGLFCTSLMEYLCCYVVFNYFKLLLKPGIYFCYLPWSLRSINVTCYARQFLEGISFLCKVLLLSSCRIKDMELLKPPLPLSDA
jgi:hypothetical protein